MSPSPRTESPRPTLEDRIQQVELRLIAREERLWTSAIAIRTRVHAAVQPRRLLRPLAIAGGVGLAAFGAWWLMRRRGGARRAPFGRGREARHTANWRMRGVAAVGLLTAVPWNAVIGLVWPLLPARFKRQVSPGAAAATVSVALPWLVRFAAPHRSPSSLRLWMSSLNGLWEGWLRMQRR